MRYLLAYSGAALMTCAVMIVLAFGGSKGAGAQSVVDTTITVGGSVTFSIDASKLALVPGCSRSAGCVSTIKLCNFTSTGAVNPASCVLLNGTAGNGSTALGYTIEETTPANTTTGAAAQANDYPVATLRISIPPAEAEVVP